MTNPYAQFDKATANFSASSLILDGKPVGRIVMKFGAATTAFVHILGIEMATGRATGGGYDKATAAIENAVMKIDIRDGKVSDPEALIVARKILEAFASASGGGARYTSTLETAGFVIANVI